MVSQRQRERQQNRGLIAWRTPVNGAPDPFRVLSKHTSYIYEKWNLRKMETSVCLLQTEKGNGKFPFVFCKQKTENRSLLSLVVIR
jgi:hypothetical protein